MEDRTCPKCDQTKPLDQFEKDNRVPSGRGTRCRACVRAYARQWRDTNRDAYNAYFKDYYQQNKEAWAERASTWYRANKEMVRAGGRRRYADSPDMHREKRKRLYRAYPDREAEKSRSYRKANPLMKRAQEAHRRALKRHAGGRFTVKDVRNQLEVQSRLCYWCSAALAVYQIDHVMPLSRGGSNGPENMVIACIRCNQLKRAMLPDEWNILRARLGLVGLC